MNNPMLLSFRSQFQKLKKVDLAIILVIAVLLVFPVYVPAALLPLIENPLSLVFFVGGVIYIFFYYNAVIGVLSIFLVYEILRRNFVGPTRSHSTMSNLFQSGGSGGGGGGRGRGNEAKAAAANPPEMNPPYATNVGEGSLEVDIIAAQAPISHSPEIPNAPYIDEAMSANTASPSSQGAFCLRPL